MLSGRPTMVDTGPRIVVRLDAAERIAFNLDEIQDDNRRARALWLEAILAGGNEVAAAALAV